ncbi:GNAT family N-acetyltransferase [Celeribacter ethanolicus]|uniref:GNAT family N-acetyltransferase n=1 Tax=Celeribacter ethanolicus TaxID=1758178 RepID=UPI000AD12E50
MTPERIAPEEARVTEALDLIRTAFAGMEGRVDPPSSMHRMTLASLTDDARTKELWGIGAPLIACVILTEKPGRLYIGKLAVAEAMQGKGLARALIGMAEDRARIGAGSVGIGDARGVDGEPCSVHPARICRNRAQCTCGL